jgi:hypothetical protein
VSYLPESLISKEEWSRVLGLWLTSGLLVFGSQTLQVQEAIIQMFNPGLVSIIAFMGLAVMKQNFYGIPVGGIMFFKMVAVVAWIIRYFMQRYAKISHHAAKGASVDDIADIFDLPGAAAEALMVPEEKLATTITLSHHNYHLEAEVKQDTRMAEMVAENTGKVADGENLVPSARVAVGCSAPAMPHWLKAPVDFDDEENWDDEGSDTAEEDKGDEEFDEDSVSFDSWSSVEASEAEYQEQSKSVGVLPKTKISFVPSLEFDSSDEE